MQVDKNIINEALKFYGIDDDSYKEKCYSCIEFYNNNDEFKNKVNSVYNVLYIDKENKIRSLWKHKNMGDLFGSDYHPFITNLLLLLGYQIHIDNIKKYNLDDEQIEIHKKRIRETLTRDIYERGMDGIRITQMLWGIYFIHIRLIEVGRLQYEYIEFNPENEEEYKQCIKMHIPAGSKLDYDEVLDSIEKSRLEIKKYFGLDNPEYYCSSWLLSREIRSVLDNDSNIAKFYDLFAIKSKNSCISDVLDFLFKEVNCDDYNSLSEDTSLQRKVKKLLLDGIDIKIGLGKLK